jgi:hypothetical protein
MIVTVVDCMTGKETSYDPDEIIADKLANGLRYAVYRNGFRYTDWPLTKEDCEHLAAGWQASNPDDTFTVAEWN